MKWKILFAVLAIMLVAGCAKTAEKTQEPVVTPPVQQEQPVVEEITQPPAPEEQAPTPTTETIILQDQYAEPATMTVAAGSTIVFKNMGTKVKIMWVKKTEFSEKSPRLEEGDSWEVTLPNPGEYEFLDLIIGKVKGTITVE